jgi:hypothetical protein
VWPPEWQDEMDRCDIEEYGIENIEAVQRGRQQAVIIVHLVILPIIGAVMFAVSHCTG